MRGPWHATTPWTSSTADVEDPHGRLDPAAGLPHGNGSRWRPHRQRQSPAVVHDVFSSTTKAQETLELTPGASPASIKMVPVTCSTECSTQVITVTHVDEVHDATTTLRPERAVDINDKEVEKLIPAWAPPTISTDTSLNKEFVPPVATTSNIDPKAVVQELDTSPLPSIDTSTPVVSDGEHGVLLVVSSNLAAPALTMRWAGCPVPASDWVKPLTATINSADETHDTAIAERLHLPSFEHQPWLPTVQVQFYHMGPLFRPSLWPSFRPLSVASYLEEPCSRIHSQSRGGSCFSPCLIRLTIRDVPRDDPINGTDSDRTCTNGIQHKVPESISTIGPLAVARSTEQEACLEEYQDASSFLHQSDPGDGIAVACESDVSANLKSLDKGSVGSFGYRNDLVVTVDDMLKSTSEDNYSTRILIQDSAWHVSYEAFYFQYNERDPNSALNWFAHAKTTHDTHHATVVEYFIHLVRTLLIMIELEQCTNPGLFVKWVVESGSSKNSKVVWQTYGIFLERVCYGGPDYAISI